MKILLARIWATIRVYFGFGVPEDPSFVGEPTWSRR